MLSPLHSKLRNSLIQLIVGLILVGFAWGYLRQHPAELQSIESSFSTVGAKIQTRWYRLRGQNNVVAQQQTSAINSLTQIIKSIQECQSDYDLSDYQQLLQTVQDADTDDFARYGARYYEEMSQAYQQMKLLCVE